jgi:hypothetical protein
LSFKPNPGQKEWSKIWWDIPVLNSKQLMSIKNVKTITINTFLKNNITESLSLKKKWVGQIQANLSFPHIFRRAWCFIVF